VIGGTKDSGIARQALPPERRPSPAAARLSSNRAAFDDRAFMDHIRHLPRPWILPHGTV